jgi:glyoxylase-like metal-dependent hydrolase (beta-lactamase superfamily II)/predicted ester cyclase
MSGTEESTKPKTSKMAAAKVARAAIEALSAHDLDALVALWEPGGRERIHGQVDTTAPQGVRTYFEEILAAVPDLRFEILQVTTEGERCTVRSRMTGTFAGDRPWRGIAPNGARLDLEVIDHFVVRDGRLVANDAYLDGSTVARQIGILPPDGSPAEQRLTKAFNLKSRMAARMTSPPEKVADRVWVLRGGVPRTMNVYLLEEADGLVVFDGGIAAMTHAVAAAGARMGGIKRLVLGHAHPDHRGIAAGLGVPVFCHPAERADAEGDGGVRYLDLSQLTPVGQRAFPRLLRMWDGGPVTIAGTVDEGDDVAGFRVVHFPGHAPGLIGLWRESDRLALVSDVVYTLNPETGRKGHARLPHAAFNQDTEQARASLRKLAALEPATVWSGHADPITGDVRSILETAAATT